MLGLLDEQQLVGIPILILPAGEYGAPSPTPTPAQDCHRCAAYRPDPQLSGNLQVDPEIHLPSLGMDVEVSYFYNATSTQNGPFGYGRTLTTNLTAQASGSPAIVTMVRGNGGIVSYQDNGSGTFVAQTPGLLNTLVVACRNRAYHLSLSAGVREPGDQKYEETSLRYVLALDFVCHYHSDFDLRDGFHVDCSASAENIRPYSIPLS
jgi:hypothetical protein